MKREPLVNRAALTTAAVTIIGLLVAFGVDVTNAQKAAILAVVGAVAPLVTAALARHKVTPVDDPRR